MGTFYIFIDCTHYILIVYDSLEFTYLVNPLVIIEKKNMELIFVGLDNPTWISSVNIYSVQ